MSNSEHSGQPPFGLTQPILSGVIAVCLGVASATAPDLFKTPLFALSMVVAVFTGWLLMRSQWPWFNKFHLRFKRAISVIFCVSALLAVGASVAFRSGGAEPFKFDSADYPLRADHANLSTNFINLSNALRSATQQSLEAARKNEQLGNDLAATSNKLIEAEGRIRQLDPINKPPSSASATVTVIAGFPSRGDNRMVGNSVKLAKGQTALLITRAHNYTARPDGTNWSEVVSLCQMLDAPVAKTVKDLAESEYIQMEFGYWAEQEIKSGKVVFSINGSVRLEFDIPPQRSQNSKFFVRGINQKLREQLMLP